ncbi:MAG TPA: Fe2+-dependent dioxygenase [Caulobacteraceae bacterium]|nr:Fe2+-dependent dioxygenase [Caulobacteraceae bacterium]
MFMIDDELLTSGELSRIRVLLGAGRFIDGRSTNPHNNTKVSHIADMSDPLMREASDIAAAAIQRSLMARNYAMPTCVAYPSAVRYGPGGQYGAHTDAAFMNIAGRPMRSDVSCTIFISDPASYAGGELVTYLGSEAVSIKGAAGAAVFYPSTTLHQVNPVLSGERLVMLTFIQSLVADADRRDVLFWLEEVRAREGLKMDWTSRVRLSYVRENLMRMWAAS